MNTSIQISDSTRSVAIRSAKGKEVGHKYFVGAKSATEIKAVGKANGLKGKALQRFVNEALGNETAARRVTITAAVASLHEAGYVPDTVTVRTKTADIRFVKPQGPSAAEVEAKVASDANAKLRALLVAQGMSDAEIDAALAVN